MWSAIGTGLLAVLGAGLLIHRVVRSRLDIEDALAEEDERARMTRH